MTQKTVKIIFIMLVILCCCITYVSASDVNLNLPGANDTADNNQATNNEANGNNNENTNNQESLNNEQGDNSADDVDDTTAPSDSETLQPNGLTSNPESGLGMTNIINILLITVGVILILLAIAIIIRLK